MAHLFFDFCAKNGLTFSPIYVKTHDSVYLNVALGETAAGGGVQKTLDRQRKEIRDNLRIIHTTTPVSPHPIAAHPRVSKEVVSRIEQVLLSLGQSEEGKKMFSYIPVKQMGEARIEDYATIKALGLERYFE